MVTKPVTRRVVKNVKNEEYVQKFEKKIARLQKKPKTAERRKKILRLKVIKDGKKVLHEKKEKHKIWKKLLAKNPKDKKLKK